jgi:hypothetical protein
MKRLLISPVVVIAISLAGTAGQAQSGPTIRGIVPGMPHAAALKVLSAEAQCTVTKETLDEGLLPSGTYDYYTSCRLNDGQGSVSYRTTTSLLGDKIREVELVTHSRAETSAAAAALAQQQGLSLAAAEHSGGAWSWQLSGHMDLAIFAYPGTQAFATVLRDTELSRQDDFAITSNTMARATPAAGSAVRG